VCRNLVVLIIYESQDFPTSFRKVEIEWNGIGQMTVVNKGGGVEEFHIQKLQKQNSFSLSKRTATCYQKRKSLISNIFLARNPPKQTKLKGHGIVSKPRLMKSFKKFIKIWIMRSYMGKISLQIRILFFQITFSPERIRPTTEITIF
jgi:hypothetical protein